ncbi:darcynin family protein [Pseudooceanicola sp. C21-150M6]|uniref:darcynin family protein n=1 Tax=Pseudooceanicola sp. C21-150M6 TaxID=3434355 RepID=UPI003D7FDA66
MLTTFLLLTARPGWLALPREERRQIAGAALAETGFDTIRHFDAEAFSAFCSDVVMVTAPDAAAQNRAMERLRDTPIFAAPYFDLVAVLPTIEDGFRQYEAEAGL